MARYFFHLRDGDDQLLDPEGTELSDKQSIEAAALRAARDTLSHELQSGRLDLRYRIDVEDEAGPARSSTSSTLLMLSRQSADVAIAQLMAGMGRQLTRQLWAES